MSHYDFREKLVISLSGIPPVSISHHKETCTEVRDSTVVESSDSGQCLLLKHQPFTVTERSRCIYCKLTQGTTHFTTRQCKECHTPLCFRDWDCFIKWHDSSFAAKREEWLSGALSAQIKPGRPIGTTITKGRGKRKRKRW